MSRKDVKIDGGLHIHVGNLTVNSIPAIPGNLFAAVEAAIGGMTNETTNPEENDQEQEEEPTSEQPGNGEIIIGKFEGVDKMFSDIKRVLGRKGIPVPSALKDALEKIVGMGKKPSTENKDAAAMQILHKAYHIVNDLSDMKVVMGLLICYGYDEVWAKEAVAIPVDPKDGKSFKTFEGKLSAAFALDLMSGTREEKYAKLAADTDPILSEKFISTRQ